jgi:methionyl-tRNA synthetase
MNEEKYIVTSALPYINGVKHLGNLIGSLLPADVYARYLRLKGKDVIAICGTDDHGTPAELSAIEAGLPVEEYVQKYYKIQKDIYERFDLSFDYFGQTSTPENKEVTQSIFLNLYHNGYIFKKEDKQLYSKTDERYLPDRYVVGTCPHCEYDRARGDQCEGCSTLLSPTELINPRSAISNSSDLEIRDTEHFYIDLPRIQPKVEAWVNEQDQWPNTTKSIAKKWLKEGLRARSITRNLKWGIDLPLEGYDDIVFYVWFDAPHGYIGITKQWANSINQPELWLDYWKNPNTTLIQFMGIDNVPFHAVTWPSSLIGADDGYILAKHVKSFQWLTYEGGKFSTSQNRGVFTNQALDLFPADYWRYYLLLIAPERQDTDFQWEGFQNAVNNDLNNSLGNLLNRAITFILKNFNGKVPINSKQTEMENKLWKDLEVCLSEYTKTFDQIEFQKPLKALKDFIGSSNKYFQESTPWKTIKTDLERTGTILSTLVHVLRSIAILSTPFIPSSAQKIYQALGGDDVHKVRWQEVKDLHIFEGNEVNNIGQLFTKITDKEVTKLKKQFGSAADIQAEVPKEEKIEEEKSKKIEKIQFEDFAKVNLISAIVLNAQPHPKADKLLVLTVDDGKRKDRTICAGIKEYYTPDKLIGKNIILVDNLEPRKIRGVISEGMVLAVEDKKGVSLLKPDRKVSSGIKVS